MVTNISEEEQRALFIKQCSIPEKKMVCEVPVFCRSVDLVEYDKINNMITSIEFKTNNWRRAIEQVLSTSISFDYAEICVRRPKKSESIGRIVEECASHGIGVYFFDVENREFEHSLEPKKIGRTWIVQKMQVIDYLEGVTCE